MEEFKNETVLVDKKGNIALRTNQVVKLTLRNDVIVQGKVESVTDKVIRFNDDIKVSFEKIKSAEIIK